MTRSVLDAGAVGQIVSRRLGRARLELHVHHLERLGLQKRNRGIRQYLQQM